MILFGELIYLPLKVGVVFPVSMKQNNRNTLTLFYVKMFLKILAKL